MHQHGGYFLLASLPWIFLQLQDPLIDNIAMTSNGPVDYSIGGDGSTGGDAAIQLIAGSSLELLTLLLF